ncbi:MAG: hypothetical protein M0P75_00050 [Candidatus Marinimicrobia bacterium]|jgi:hypothetical protein|nr:hypothetical protein [Candidatus Neomarinimicrobiota bacterium]
MKKVFLKTLYWMVVGALANLIISMYWFWVHHPDATEMQLLQNIGYLFLWHHSGIAI